MHSVRGLARFVAVAHCGGVTATAREQGTRRGGQPSAGQASSGSLEETVSSQQPQRERDERRTDIFSLVEVILEDLRQAEYLATGGQSQWHGHLKVTLSLWILSRFILPVPGGFREQHPELSVEF